MELDPELAPYLNTPFPNNFDDIEWSRREQSRLAIEENNHDVEPTTIAWVDQSIGNRISGRPLRVRIYRPTSLDDVGGAVLFFHGGAFVFGDLESEHRRCVRYCEEARCLVVSVEYSLAPENRFPAAFEDGVSALRWLTTNAEALGINPSRIVVCGVSAGGAIASSVVLHARDIGEPTVCAQLLVYPVIDSHADTPSVNEYFHAEPFNGEMAVRMWQLYAPGAGAEAPYASAARALNLRGMPPTYIVTADHDPLRDEGLDYAIALIDAGNVVELHHIPRTFHGFDTVAPRSRLSQRALDEQCRFLSEQFAT